mgnify:CR=1 FL=1
MYTILIRNTNDAIASNRTRIMQRSKLVDDLHFLVEPIYNDYDMQDFTVTLEYRLPVSHEYRTEILVLSEELYKEYYEYKLPIDTCITKEPGDVEMLITFSKAEMDADGKVIQRVRKISPCYLTVIAVTDWSSMIPDDALTPLDQRIIELGALANQLADTQDLIAESKADDLSYKDNTLQLLANGKPIGTSHILDQQTEFDVVEFGNSDDPNEPDSDANTFIEF